MPAVLPLKMLCLMQRFSKTILKKIIKTLDFKKVCYNVNANSI